MSLATLRAEIAECREWELRLHGGSKETRDADAIPGLFAWILPAIMPVYGLLAWSRGAQFGSEGWVAIFPWWVFLCFDRLCPGPVPSEWEALRLPSRRARLLARLSFRAPWLLWLGACTFSWVVLLALRDHSESGLPPALLSAAILVAPFLAATFQAWFHVQAAAFGGQTAMAPLLATLLGMGLTSTGAVIAILKGSQDSVAYGVGSVLGVAGILILGVTVPSWRGLLRTAPGGSPGGRLGNLLRTAIVGMAGAVPVLATLAAVVVLRSARSPGGVHPVLDAVLLPASVLGTVLLLADALRLLALADVGVLSPPAQPGIFEGRERIRAALPGAATAGRGLAAAAWALYRGRWRNLRHPWLLFLPKLAWECRAPACGFIAMIAPVILSVEGTVQSALSLWLTAVFLLLVPSPLNLPASRRLHLLGADFTAVARHNLRWGTLLAVLPATLGGAFFLLFAGKLPARGIVGALLLCVGVLLLRQGPSAIETFHAVVPGRGPRIAVVVLATAGLIYGWGVDGPTSLLALGEITFLLAAVAVIRDLRDPEGAGRRLEAAAADD